MKSPFILTLIVLSALCVVLAIVYAAIQCHKPKGGGGGGQWTMATQPGRYRGRGRLAERKAYTHVVIPDECSTKLSSYWQWNAINSRDNYNYNGRLLSRHRWFWWHSERVFINWSAPGEQCRLFAKHRRPLYETLCVQYENHITAGAVWQRDFGPIPFTTMD